MRLNQCRGKQLHPFFERHRMFHVRPNAWKSPIAGDQALPPRQPIHQSFRGTLSIHSGGESRTSDTTCTFEPEVLSHRIETSRRRFVPSAMALFKTRPRWNIVVWKTSDLLWIVIETARLRSMAEAQWCQVAVKIDNLPGGSHHRHA